MTGAARRRQPPAVVFDCDGVLLDTEAAWTRAYTILLGRYRTLLGARQRQALLGRSLDAVGRLLEGFLDQPGHAYQLAAQALRLARAKLRHGAAPYPVPPTSSATCGDAGRSRSPPTPHATTCSGCSRAPGLLTRSR